MAIEKATPAIYHQGIKDESGAILTPEPLQLPQHLPLFYCQMERGRLSPQLSYGLQRSRTFGEKSFKEEDIYFSHQTQAANIVNAAGNLAFLKRVVGAGGKKATIRLSKEIGEDVYKPYKRNPDGSVVIDSASGQKVRDDTAPDVTGKIFRWIAEEIADDFGTAKEKAGPAYGSAGNPSRIIPIMDMEMDSEGLYGSNTGFRLWYPHSGSSVPGDILAMDEQEQNVYRLQMVERAAKNKAPVVISNNFSSRTTDFSFIRGMIGTAKVSYDSQLPVKAYQVMEEGYLPEYGPLGRFHVYNNFIDPLQKEIDVAEAALDSFYDSAPGRVNLFNGVNGEGHEYHSFYMDPTGLTLTEGTTIYLLGGKDGVVSEEELGKLVKVECDTNWENLDYPLVDHAQFPFSVLYDTGFPFETKESILSTLGYRGDISVGVCTQDLAQPENTQAQERAIGTALNTSGRMVPESVIYGTSTCRAVVYGQMARLKQSVFGRRLPLIMEAIHKRAKFMGAANGILKATEAYDISPKNRLELMVEPSHTWKTAANRDGDWDNGVNWVQYSEMGRIFFPAYQTIYDDDTSIINSEINMLIAVDVKKMQQYLWTEFSGRSDLTPAQFVERHNERFDELVAGRYLGRVRIVSETTISGADAERGYSWTHSAVIYGNVAKTVATLNVITRREV